MLASRTTFFLDYCIFRCPVVTPRQYIQVLLKTSTIEKENYAQGPTTNYRISQVIVPGRAFLRRLINLSIGLNKPYQHVRINAEAKKDMQSWLAFLSKFNGTILFDYGPWVTSECIHLFTDAAGSKGYRSWPSQWHSYSIAFLELYPIMAAICVWADKLCNKRIILHTDNKALESIINKSTSKHQEIMHLVRQIVTTCMIHNIHIRAQHIAGNSNRLADMLYRSQVDQFLAEATWADSVPTKLPSNIQPMNLFQL